MTPLWHLTWRSMRNRKLTVALTLLSIALSVMLLLGVERVRSQARASFTGTVAGTDLIVGARSGPVQLLLYSVFHIGNATNEIAWSSIEMLRGMPAVDWVVPIALGDSHRGFRVVGTDAGLFDHFRYGDHEALGWQDGRPFSGSREGLFEAVIGAELARSLGYRVGQRIALAHGAGEVSLVEHADRPFTVVGVLAPTGTPIDRSVLVSLMAIEAIHIDWVGGMPMPGLSLRPDQLRKFSLTPKRVTAALLGLKTRAAVFQAQRQINEYREEPLLAILPGATLQDLWRVVAVGERALQAVAALVVVVGLVGLIAVTVAGLGERRRELAILRALGAGPRAVFALVACEAMTVTAAGIVAGVLLITLGLAALSPWLAANWGLRLGLAWPDAREWALLAAVLVAGVLASLVPAARAYRLSLADGMVVRQ